MKMMRPMFYAMLGFSILAISSTQQQTSTDWQTNKDVVDLIIVIHYENNVTQPNTRRVEGYYPALRGTLNGLTENLPLGADTRMGILEFGGDQEPKWLVPLGDGINEWNRKIVGLGQMYSSQSTRWVLLNAVVTQAGEEARNQITPERRHVPQLIVIVTEVAGGQFGDRNTNKGIATRLVNDLLRGITTRFHLLLIDGFRTQGQVNSARMEVIVDHGATTNYNVDASSSGREPRQVATRFVSEVIVKGLGTCRFKQTDSKCYVTNQDGCVFDRNFTFGYVPHDSSANPSEGEWTKARMYCFKNASIPCPQEKQQDCPTTPTTASTSTSTSKSTASTVFTGTTDPNATEITGGGTSSISTTADRGSTSNATSPSPSIASSTSTGGNAEDDESDEVGDDFVWNDDPRYIAAKQRLIGSAIAFFVVLVIVTPIVIYGAIEYRKYRAALAKLPAGDAIGQQSQVGDPWTLVSPPEFTLTPASQLYAGGKSSKSQKKTA